jgi:peptide/nickel transport system substrate-binding protein
VKRGLLIKAICLAMGLVVIASMLAIACGTTTPATTTTTKPAATTTTAIKTTTPAATTVKPVTGGTLRYGVNQDYPTIGNPVTQTYSAGAPLTDVCLETLVMLNEKGEPKPFLATGWSFDSTGTVLTLNLRKGVKFHDGTAFNASAARWNLDRVVSANKTEVASIKSVDIIDDSTIKLNLKNQDGLLLIYLGGMRGMMISPTAYEKAAATEKERTAWAEANPVGTGPFKFVSWEHDVRIVFEKFADYWQPGKPYLDKIVFTIIVNEATLMASFRGGELDVMYTQQPQNIKSIEDEGKYALLKGDVSLCGALEGDSKHPNSPWANIKVRQAAAYAVDNEQFAKTIGFGYWKGTNQFDVPERWGYNPSVVGYPYNVEKGKALMAEAGYANGFTTTIYGMSHYTTMLAALQGYLSKIGITANSKIVTPAERVDMFGKAGWDGLWLWECTVQPSTLVNMGRNFTAAAAPGRMISVDVPADFSALVSKAITATDFKTQQEMTWQLQKDLVDKYAFLTFIYGQYVPLPMTKKVHDIKVDASNHWTPADTWLEK